MPEHLVGVTAQGIQVVPAVNQRKASWILKDEVMVSTAKTRGGGEAMSGRPMGGL